MAEVEQVTHTYRAEVGTKNFYEDDVLQTLDTEIYLKDGYVMLPVRTFFTAVDENAQILWDREKQVATVWMGECRILLDVPKNKIQVEYGNVNVSGKLEVKDGRLFVPLRNWQKILTRCNYEMDENSIVWDSEKGEAIVNVGEYVINREQVLEKTEIIGEGQKPVYLLEPTEEYDSIQNVGDGYFIVEKRDNVGELEIFNSTGKVLATFAPGTISRIGYLGEDRFYIYKGKEQPQYVVDANGNQLFSVPYDSLRGYNEGLALVREKTENGYRYGYIDTEGNLQIPMQYGSARSFSEGVAPVSMSKSGMGQYGFIDTKGNVVIEPKYRSADPFREGLAHVQAISGEGSSTIREKKWFRPSMVLSVESTEELSYFYFPEGDLLEVDYPQEYGGVDRYYDKNGEISRETYELQSGFSEGLSAVLDKETGKYLPASWLPFPCRKARSCN